MGTAGTQRGRMSSTASPEVLDAPKEKEPKSCQVLPGGFAGTGPNGSFFEAPAWVDKSKAPGTTSQEAAVAPPGWWIPLATGKFLFFSPNLVWLLIALVDYFVFPYDFQPDREHKEINVLPVPQGRLEGHQRACVHLQLGLHWPGVRDGAHASQSTGAEHLLLVEGLRGCFFVVKSINIQIYERKDQL